MHWPRDLEGWPHREASTRIAGPVHRWHVQASCSPDTEKRDILLLHGAGASTHSWRHLFTLLSDRFRVKTLDLPGHGFTTLGARHRSGLTAMAEDVTSLCTAQEWRPATIIGHSAGAAVALEAARRGPLRGVPVIGLNAALGAFPGLAGVLFPMLAQVLAAAPLVPRLVARQVGQARQIARLIESTGSTLDPEGLELYRHLAADPDHVSGTLQMMAQWDLDPLLESLGEHPSDVTLFATEGDRSVPAITSVEAAKRLRQGQAILHPELGHLAHEEDAERVLGWILPYLPD
ncbi:alpha/beta fold hydrolase BchO [Pseudaestuariivita atlantica]|uniref:AB hydrolase-1 domain-containing protein n=1 Tax=Pseudaestuariivita atlantica TaxID=1317121 RepID=A0A0L1JPR6_9RHOB|nr:alpha/beta fold hydrolase BchO [Pseudaestuariivita atlantica]KNG93726.1 hypothetical protein ATO11_11100 [Pseudaestuariivita atlantica]